MNPEQTYVLTNRQNGNLAFKLFWFQADKLFHQVQRINLYTLVWIKEGEGRVKADFSEYHFASNTLFSFTPYQPFQFRSSRPLIGVTLQYHSDFYCIHQNPEADNCDTVIFNNPYEAPFTQVDPPSAVKLDQTLKALEEEWQNTEHADHKLLVPYLKIFLITASRIRTESRPPEGVVTDIGTSSLLRSLQTAIEDNFREKHAAGEYARLLHISPNALARLVKNHLHTTLTDLITQRIIIQAKRELYMTSSPVKEIAWQLGYLDEYYFSRLQKMYGHLPQCLS